MSLFRMRTALCLFSLLFGLHSAAGAQTITEASARLQELEARQQRLTAEQQRIQQRIEKQQSELQTLEQRPSPERDELNNTRAELDRARAAYAADPSDDNQAKLKNAEFRFHLAERKYAKANEEYSALLGELEASREELVGNETALTQLSARIAEQRATADRLREEQLRRERTAREQQQQTLQLRDQQLQAREREMQRAQQEIERLKALLEDKEQQAAPEPGAPAPTVASGDAANVDASPAASAAAAMQDAAQPEAEQTKPEAATPTPAMARPDTTLPAAPEQKPAAATATADKAAAAASPAVTRLTDQTAVIAELQRLEQATANTGRKKGLNRILHVKPDTGDKVLITLRPLGNDQFRGTSEELPAGAVELVIGLNKWQTTIDPVWAGKTVVIVFDANAATPRLVYYDQALEQ